MNPVEFIKLKISFDVRLGHTVMDFKINKHYFPLNFGEGEKYIL